MNILFTRYAEEVELHRQFAGFLLNWRRDKGVSVGSNLSFLCIDEDRSQFWLACKRLYWRREHYF